MKVQVTESGMYLHLPNETEQDVEEAVNLLEYFIRNAQGCEARMTFVELLHEYLSYLHPQ